MLASTGGPPRFGGAAPCVYRTRPRNAQAAALPPCRGPPPGALIRRADATPPPPRRCPPAGDLGDLDHPPAVAAPPPPAGPRRLDVVGARAAAGVDHDLDSIALH